MPIRLYAFLCAAVVVVLDRLSKVWIETHVSTWDTHVIIPNVFNIIYTRNPGAAFGVLATSSSQYRTALLVGVSTLVLLFIAYAIWRPAKVGFAPNRLVMTGLSLVLGGAIGNVYDRIVYGSVTDFLQVFLGSYEWPAFNIADSAISIGACLLLIDMLRSRQTHPSTASAGPVRPTE